jgi:uncharacterized YigZ family protein
MKYSSDISNYTHEVKQSKFIAHFVPYELYEETLQNLKTLHPKARHFVTAFRYINEYGQIVEHSSDDGEPKGTSGKPSLMVLQGEEIVNAAVIVVRYFGGTKLGTGGLVRAYSDTLNLLIEKIEFFEYKKEMQKSITLAYEDLRLIEYECQVMDIKILEKIFDVKILCKMSADEKSMKAFLEKMSRVITVL